MKKNTAKYTLPFNETLVYFLPHVSCGNALSNSVCKEINFSRGSFFTILPHTVRSDLLLNFEIGIIPPIPYGDKTYKIKGLAEEFHPTQVITTDAACSELVFKFLQRSRSHVALVESTLLKVGDSHLKIKGVETLPLGRDICYVLNHKNSVSEICDTLRKAGDVWHFLMVLTCLRLEKDVVDESVIPHLCGKAQFVVAGAYDGEGFIFWQSSETIEDLI